MKYMGSKARYAKYILPIMLKDRVDGQYYVEPFVGGANIIDKVIGNRIGADINEYNIALFKAIQDGWIPPDFVSEYEYKNAREKKEISAYTAFIGYGCSYSGKWFGGYARGKDKNGKDRNYCMESKKNIMNQKEGISGVLFVHSDYSSLEIPSKSIIYCDPPYENTTSYMYKFDHNHFWDWCRKMQKNGHTVFVSEYNAPPDFECVWSMEVTSSLTKDTGSKRSVERLFRYSGVK